MKKITLILCIIIGISNCKALEIINDTVITEKGYIISYNDYNKLNEILSNETIDILEEEMIDSIINSDDIKESTLYEVTTYEYGYRGEILSENSVYTDEATAKSIKYKNLYVTENGEIKQKPLSINGVNPITYSTTSKEIKLYGTKGENQQTSVVKVNWFKLPTVRKFDIVAIRWNNGISTNKISVSGTQISDEKTSTYNSASENFKVNSNGAGVSTNLHDNAKNELRIEMVYLMLGYTGDKIYATYQHAKNSNANKLEISQSYNFDSRGLGGVVYFSNKTYGSYYDGMKGVEA